MMLWIERYARAVTAQERGRQLELLAEVVKVACEARAHMACERLDTISGAAHMLLDLAESCPAAERAIYLDGARTLRGELARVKAEALVQLDLERRKMLA
jgi:hypothetical protein